MLHIKCFRSLCLSQGVMCFPSKNVHSVRHTWWGAPCTCLHPVLKQVLVSSSEMKGEATDEEGNRTNASHQRGKKTNKKNQKYYFKSWLGETFGIWMGTADPRRQFFRYMHFVSGKNLVWRKEGRKNVCVPIYLILRVYEFKASFSNCINTANCT